VTAFVPGDPCFIEPRAQLPGGRRIRVLQVLATGSSGGAQEHVRSLVSRLDQARYEVSVVSLGNGPSVRRIRATGTSVEVIDEPTDETAVARLAAVLLERQPEILHLHMYRAEVVGTRAALAVARAGGRRPYVIATVHSSRRRSAEDQELLRRLTPAIDQLVAVSDAIARKLQREGRVGPAVQVIYNGVDLGRYREQPACRTLPTELGFPDDAPLVGVVARLEPEKGHETLLAAWRLVLQDLPQARLVIVGEGSEGARLRGQALQLGLQAPRTTVFFTGLREDVPAVTAALDVAVLPSYREAQGIVLLEAMALGRPIVATRVGGIPEVVEDGRTGLLVPPHDAPALADGILRLLGDRVFAKRLGEAGQERAHEKFCIERMIDALQTLYDQGAARVAPGLLELGAA
jgi:glycosyltransferase involved in cell wall biosynthesis